MGSTFQEPKQIACMKRGRCDFEVTAKTERFTDYIPTKKQKVAQKAGTDSLGVPQEDPKESMRFGRVIRGIQSRRFGRDPVAVSQSFPVGFVSGETALNRPATLNVSFQFMFLMSVSQREYMELPLSSAYIP